MPIKTILAGNKITKIKAILNGTTNYILTKMDVQGASYSDVLAESQDLGYADGYCRGLSNTGSVLIHGKRAPICGRVCMDQFMVDVTDIPDVKIGDEVTLIGRDGDEVITMEEVGSLSGRFNYEFVCVLGKRIPRVFYRDGKRIASQEYFDEE
jgi:hypothetical protein